MTVLVPSNYNAMKQINKKVITVCVYYIILNIHCLSIYYSDDECNLNEIMIIYTG